MTHFIHAATRALGLAAALSVTLVSQPADACTSGCTESAWNPVELLSAAPSDTGILFKLSKACGDAKLSDVTIEVRTGDPGGSGEIVIPGATKVVQYVQGGPEYYQPSSGFTIAAWKPQGELTVGAKYNLKVSEPGGGASSAPFDAVAPLGKPAVPADLAVKLQAKQIDSYACCAGGSGCGGGSDPDPYPGPAPSAESQPPKPSNKSCMIAGTRTWPEALTSFSLAEGVARPLTNYELVDAANPSELLALFVGRRLEGKVSHVVLQNDDKEHCYRLRARNVVTEQTTETEICPSALSYLPNEIKYCEEAKAFKSTCNPGPPGNAGEVDLATYCSGAGGAQAAGAAGAPSNSAAEGDGSGCQVATPGGGASGLLGLVAALAGLGAAGRRRRTA